MSFTSLVSVNSWLSSLLLSLSKDERILGICFKDWNLPRFVYHQLKTRKFLQIVFFFLFSSTIQNLYQLWFFFFFYFCFTLNFCSSFDTISNFIDLPRFSLQPPPPFPALYHSLCLVWRPIYFRLDEFESMESFLLPTGSHLLFSSFTSVSKILLLLSLCLSLYIDNISHIYKSMQPKFIVLVGNFRHESCQNPLDDVYNNLIKCFEREEYFIEESTNRVLNSKDEMRAK